MKKFTFLSAVLVAGMATAQVVQVAPEQLKLQKVMPQSIEMNKEVSLKEWTGYSEKGANASYDLADYYVVDGMMYGGLTAEWGAYPYGFFMVPAYQNVVFENVYGPTTWTINGATEAENTESLEYGLLLDGMYYLPQTLDHMWQKDDTTLLSVKGYIYGSTEQAQYLIAGANHMIASDGIVPLTQCEMNCDPMYNESGSDFYIVSAQSLGCPYAYGTDLVYEGKSLDTIISTVRNVNPLKIYQINMPIYNAAATSIEEILPEGAQVKVEIIAADFSEGVKIFKDSIYASTIINPEDCQVLSNGCASLVAKFTEEDPFGGIMEVAVLCPGDFAVQITGYNEGNCDFGFMTDYYAPIGSTIFAVNGGYTEFWSGGSNLAISYDAYWPGALFAADSEALVAPVEGGIAMDGEYEAFVIYTNVYDLDVWMIDEEASAEWLEFVYDDSALASEGYLLGQLTATALPEGETGRQGALVIDVDGYKLSIPVVQGEVVNTGVDNVVVPTNNKTYNLLGVEVDENYKGIVIKNGKKTIQ